MLFKLVNNLQNESKEFFLLNFIMHNFEKQCTMCTNIISALYLPLLRCVLTNKQTNKQKNFTM